MPGPQLTAHLLGPADYRLMPWKNGRGATTELAIDPREADLGSFDWRISMADVSADGEFSAFPGYDRTLVLAGGAGMELDFSGAAPAQRLTLPGHAARFSGDWRARARLLAGPVRDFNVMSARSRLQHACEAVAAVPLQFNWAPAQDSVFCHCISGTLVLKMRGNAEWTLGAAQSLYLPAAAAQPGQAQLMIMPHSRNTLAAVVRLRRL